MKPSLIDLTCMQPRVVFSIDIWGIASTFSITHLKLTEDQLTTDTRNEWKERANELTHPLNNNPSQ